MTTPTTTRVATGPSAGVAEPPATPAPRAWSLQRRFNRSVVAVLILLFVLIATIVGALFSAKTKGDDVVEKWDPALLDSQALNNAMVNQETGVRGFVLGTDEAFLQPYVEYQEEQTSSEQRLRALLADDPQLIELLDGVLARIDTWQEDVAQPVIAQVRSGDTTVADDFDTADSKAAFDAIRDASSALSDAIEELRADAKSARTRAFAYVWITVGVGSSLLLAVGVLLTLGLRRSVLAPISGLVGQTRQVAGGDLGREIVQPGPREIEDLAADVDSMRAGLASQIERIERARLRLQARSAELARSNADLEQFAYVASHDLSEPLRKVTNFCQLLERQYADQLDDKARQYIAFMIDGAKRMQFLITDLLSFSRVGRTTEHFARIDLNDTLAKALGNLEDQITAAGARVINEPLPTVTGDPTLLTALLQNLVGNAVKYRSVDRPPWVEITTERTVEGGVDLWLFTVSDNGIGIERQYAERIFTIFQRLHLRDEYGGTGIGLALCRKIVDFHKGRIWLAEKADPGARFQFTLPLHHIPLESVDDDEPPPRAHP